VWDAEYVRRELAGDAQWSTLGQSFGGFITTAYLSLAPEGLEKSLLTGGLPGLTHVDEIYRRTYAATAKRNQTYFSRYASD
nr:alpha/beta hydrolase [Streptococcus anginosus]